jgi:hypothetical protein
VAHQLLEIFSKQKDSIKSTDLLYSSVISFVASSANSLSSSEQLRELSNDFIKENYLTYVDIYQLIVKRYCIVDFTIEDNLQVAHQLLEIFSKQKDSIKSTDLLYSSVISKLTDNKDYQISYRSNEDATHVIFTVFGELDKQLYSFRPLISEDNLRTISAFYEIIFQAKKKLEEHLHSQAHSLNGDFFSSLYNSLFSSTNEASAQFSKLTITDVTRCVDLSSSCLCLVKDFYKSQSMFLDNNIDDFFSAAATAAAAPPLQSYNNDQGQNSNLNLIQENRLLRNGLIKSNIQANYNPDATIIGEYENKFMVFMLRSLSNYLNEKFGQDFESNYHRTDFVGKCAKKILYMPSESVQIIKSKSKLAKSLLRDFESESFHQSQSAPRPRLSLRRLASHKFLLYFFLIHVFTKTVTGYSVFFSFVLVSLLFLLHALCKS